MSEGELVPKGANELVADSSKFVSYLESLNLPTDNVIASTDERQVVGENLSKFLHGLSDEEKREARYLSKFVGATAVGLFDAALNYVWNEVVLNLRAKAVLYGVDLFFDAAVGGKNRDLYTVEEDLAGLKDQVLLDTCRKLELVSDIVYQKLMHILTMRNQIAASHPNVEQIGGFELLGWLQTCVRDVLQDKPSESAIKIQSIVQTLKAAAEPIDKKDIAHFSSELKNLSSAHVHNLLVTIFGMFVANASGHILRKNISLIAKPVWDHSLDQVKTKLASRIDGYRTNLQADKVERSREFLTITDGLHFESLPARIIALEELTLKLHDAHAGWDNFYNEPSVMKEILPYIKNAQDVPSEVKQQLIEAVLKCRVGNGVDYCGGVSSSGKSMYDQFFMLMDDEGIYFAVRWLYQPHLNARIRNPNCYKALGELLELIKENIISERLKEIIDFLLKDVSKAHKAAQDKDFASLLQAFSY